MQLSQPYGNCSELLLPTAYLPSLEYMMYVIGTKTAVIELYETWPKQTWRNRCSIMTANGKLDLVIPVSRPDGKCTITKDVCISKHEQWHKKHWRAISAAYKNAPFFMHYSDLLEPFYTNPPAGKLWHFNKQLLQNLLSAIGIHTKLKETTAYEKEASIPDLRQEMTPKTHRRLRPVADQWPVYYQVFSEKHGFKPNLSIIDLLFNMGPDSKSYLETAEKLHQLKDG